MAGVIGGGDGCVMRGWEAQSGERGRPSDQAELLQVLTAPDELYHCPGEPLPISSAVHHARLRAHYVKCRECPHREDSGLLSDQARQGLQEIWAVRDVVRQVWEDGFRGVQYNEFNQQTIRMIAEAYCQQVWQEVLQAETTGKRRRPKLVLGHDSRVSSLETLNLAMAAVLEQGASVIDVGEVSASCLMFAVGQLEADGGLHATSAEASATVIGLDLYGGQGYPLSGESLRRVEQIGEEQRARGARTTAPAVPFPARKAYLGSLWKHYQNIAEGRILVACESEFIRHLLNDLNAELPLKLLPFLPESCQQLTLTEPAFVQEFQARLQAEECDWGVVLGEEGQRCWLLESNGRVWTAAEMLRLLLEPLVLPSGKRPIVLLGEEWPADAFEAELFAAERVPLFRQRRSLREHFARGLKTSQAQLGLDCWQRFWWPGELPSCDGLVTLGKLLQALANRKQKTA